ncbi:Sm protein [Trichomonas vaginalis G3]|uniref:Small nuclear ribonucleoprotein E n=1 Tax=Trichomonas vaginalis (strain ATCC PRA-98 / G3) TaxID=412133 RepID=A2EQ40_TRIV3|nr:spliceosomal snRNP assembly [Trichomonas vaginalis G3]EAY05215.1 Sm protein [Trichomonas vaginalis G3]KAI5542618.1 spliceosomal snRNP assembly [Trichomonas vaginalis G3]|eukprot:XP_001317438.1 Sm protein [Trichomonas vaginalis G3]
MSHERADPTHLLEPPLKIYVSYLKERARLRVHLNDNSKMYMEGNLLGFDEYMNLVLGDSYEVYPKENTRVPLGTSLLRGECVGMVHPIPNIHI